MVRRGNEAAGEGGAGDSEAVGEEVGDVVKPLVREVVERW